MNFQEKELDKLKRSVLIMIEMSRNQLDKSMQALLNWDEDLAEEVVFNEQRLNAMEISNEDACEEILACHQPVATDLRLVLAMLKCVSCAERIGDHANGIAKFVIKLDNSFDETFIEAIKLKEVHDLCLDMLDNVIDALENEDAQLARKVFKKDKKIDKINRETAICLASIATDINKDMIQSLYLNRTMGKLERVGDMIKNISEEIIFYLEAKVLKHNKKKQKKEI